MRLWDVPPITSIATAPFLNPENGRIVHVQGYDLETGIYLAKGFPELEEGERAFSEDYLTQCLQVLWSPFKEFPLEGAIDHSVLLAGILTAIIRPALPTAPAYLVESPYAGSGKTLLASALAVLSGIKRPSVTPVSGNSEELRKKLLALGRSGESAIILDNISAPLSSDALCSWLTSEEFSDRLLGSNLTLNVPTRSLCLITGNNVEVKGDLNRRVFKIRINPDTEKPWDREFAFDPKEYCFENRLDIVKAGLVLLKAAISSGDKPEGRTASFEFWSDTVRLTVCWLAEQEWSRSVFRDAGMQFTDPAVCINKAYDEDPETELLNAVLETWCKVLSDTFVTVSDVADSTDERMVPLIALLADVAGDGGGINSRMLGKWLTKYKGRVSKGRFIERGKTRNGSRLWRVVVKQGV